MEEKFVKGKRKNGLRVGWWIWYNKQGQISYLEFYKKGGKASVLYDFSYSGEKLYQKSIHF